MKKLLYLLLMLPAALFTSCQKDEVKPFDLTLTVSGVTQENGKFYAVAGEDVTITNLSVTPLGDKATEVANVMFFVDGRPIINLPWEANPFTFSTSTLIPGNHTIDVTGNLLQVDSSIKDFAVSYPLVIVDSEENLPSDAPEIGQYSQTVTFNQQN